MSATTRLTLRRGRVDVGPDLTVAVLLTLDLEPPDFDRHLLGRVLAEVQEKPPQLIEMSLMHDGLMLVVKLAENLEGVLRWLITGTGDSPGALDRVARKYDELHAASEQAHRTAADALATFNLTMP